MRLIAPLIFIFAVLSGCATQPTPEELANIDYGSPPSNYEQQIRHYFEARLFDPYSAHYDFQQPTQTWVKAPPLRGGGLKAGWLVRVGVNAKNRMGGYVGRKTFGFLFKNDAIIAVYEPWEMENANF
jgi:hypothetical protein